MRRIALTMLLGLGPMLTAVLAQTPGGPGDPTTAPRSQPRRPARPPTTHAPLPELPPTRVMHHVRQGNRAVVAARKKRQPLPRPARRPSAAGRYVCAVFVCADADVNVAEALGLRRRDVLVLSNPGPFVQPEAVALIEQQVQRERLALVLVLTHEQCETLAMKSGDTSRTKALAGRVAPIGRRARRHKVSMAKAMARHQREVLLASSPRLQKRAAKDQLRILPASIDPRTLRLTWHTTRADEMPMAPVK